jgi:hypothetical protein
MPGVSDIIPDVRIWHHTAGIALWPKLPPEKSFTNSSGLIR